MITRPSISELMTGLLLNLESMTARAGDGLAASLTPVLTVLDRVNREWSSWSALLETDNDDIRATLHRLDVALEEPGQDAESPTLASLDSLRRVEQLEQQNRALKAAQVETIDRLDLPAGAGATPAQRHADNEILALLQRMLHREDQVHVAAPRVAATSGNPSRASIPLDELSKLLTAFIAERQPGATDIAIDNLQTLTGGASREAWIFDARWREAGQQRVEPCILMREPIASVLVSDSSEHNIDGTRRTVHTELRAVKAMAAAGLPVPHVLWSDTEGVWFERPFSISRRLPGTADVNEIIAAGFSDALLDEYVEILSRIHALRPDEAGVEFLGTPTEETAAIEQVDQFERNYHAQRLEEFPAITYLIRWLRKHQPRARRVGVVHGDYRLGNFLCEDGRIVAVLDWEQVHVGDPVEEIAFMYWSVWSLEAICPIDDFVARYEAATGCEVDREALAYYRLFIEFKMLIVLLTGVKAFYATPERQLHYGSGQTPEMIRDSQLRAIEELVRGGPTVAFDAYQKRAG